MKTNILTAIASLFGGIAVGAAVFVAMDRNTHIYFRFVGLVGVALVTTIAVKAYRTYFGHRSEPVVEETTPEGGDVR